MPNIKSLIVDKLIENQTIKEDERDIYEYGFGYMFDILLNIVATLAIALIFDRVLDTLLFLIAVIPMRSYAGGYHAKTPLRCFVFSVIAYALVLISATLSFSYMDEQYINITLISIIMVSYCIVFMFAPVDSVNKRLDDRDRKRYKKISIFLLLILTIIYILGYLFFKQRAFLCFCYGLFFVMISLLAGHVKNIIEEE